MPTTPNNWSLPQLPPQQIQQGVPDQHPGGEPNAEHHEGDALVGRQTDQDAQGADTGTLPADLLACVIEYYTLVPQTYSMMLGIVNKRPWQRHSILQGCILAPPLMKLL